MGKVIGLIFVVLCVFGGYGAGGGDFGVLWQPFEFIIIVGAGIGAYIIANPAHVSKDTFGSIGSIFKPNQYGKAEYIELLSMLYLLFKTARSKGWLVLEQHIEEPKESDIFNRFPIFHGNHHAVTFLTDYLRLISLGSDKPYEIEALMDQEIETKESDGSHVGHAVQALADGLPALGIVAAVLGVIHTMGSITEPPEVLGHLIGGALVGTFLGILLSYGFVAPIAGAILARADADLKYYLCMRTCILAFLQGAAPQISIEFGRKIITHNVQPTFIELEQATENVT